MLHGGEPGLAYAADGLDRVSFAGAGPVAIAGHADAEEHVARDFTAIFKGGETALYSIEELVWDDRSDVITVGPGAGLIRSSLSISTGGGGDWIDAGAAQVLLTVDSGAGDDVIVAGDAPIAIATGSGRDQLVIASPRARLDIADAGRDDRLVVPWDAKSMILSREAAAPSDAVLSILGEDEDAATLYIRDFAPGDMGICAEPPARLSAHMLGLDAGTRGCTEPGDDRSEHIHPAVFESDGYGHF